MAAMQASRVRRDATVSANETGGFKYIPGGRTLLFDRRQLLEVSEELN